MTAPRQILPGTTYLVTRRCSQRQFLLRPSKATNQLFGYLLAVAAERFHIEVHAFCVMSNHAHVVITDPEAHLPAFSQFLDSLVGRSMNALLGRRENFWSPSNYSAVVLCGSSDIVDKIAYVLANPVTAGLVRRGRAWPGLWSAPTQMDGRPLEFERPRRFFREKGATALPARATLRLVLPPSVDSPGLFQRAVSEALEVKEETAALDLASHGRGFLGLQRVMAQRVFSQPPLPEPLRRLNPRIACKDKWRRIQALGLLVEFLQAYRQAWSAWRSGLPGVLFPPGTYLMRLYHRAPCAAPA